MHTNVSELVLDARCEMAMAHVTSPLDLRAAIEHCRRARRWVYRAGAASITDTPVPVQFDGSHSLTGAWLCGCSARQRDMQRLAESRVAA